MKNLVIFGCGYHGRAAYRVLKNNKKNFLGWVDNDKKKHFKKLFRKTIFPVQQLKNLNFTDIIFCGRDTDDQIKQYKKLKLKGKIHKWDSIKLTPPLILQNKREKLAFKILQKLIYTINSKKIFYWVDTSGLLQLIRNKKISYLSDFDLSFFIYDLNKVLKIFHNSKNFDVIKKKISVKKTKIFVRGKNNFEEFEPPTFDFHFKISKQQYMFESYNLKKKIPLKYFKYFKIINFQGLSLRIPKKATKYLEYLYGKKGWKKRIRFFKNPLAKKNRPFLGPVDSN